MEFLQPQDIVCLQEPLVVNTEIALIALGHEMYQNERKRVRFGHAFVLLRILSLLIQPPAHFLQGIRSMDWASASVEGI